jgi:hypothetical protein
MTSGARQGCLLSPLIYAVVGEVLTDKLESTCPDMLVRDYADDTALGVRDFWKTTPLLQGLFDDFARLSGLHLNKAKSYIIPLNPAPLDAFSARRDEEVPAWSSMPVARGGKYLGFVMGRGKKDASWNTPAGKFMQRAQIWRDQPLGLQRNAMVYNTFAMSVLDYISQLECPTDWLLDKERAAPRKAAKGPGAWAKPEDLWGLKEHFGLARFFRCLS